MWLKLLIWTWFRDFSLFALGFKCDVKAIFVVNLRVKKGVKLTKKGYDIFAQTEDWIIKVYNIILNLFKFQTSLLVPFWL